MEADKCELGRARHGNGWDGAGRGLFESIEAPSLQLRHEDNNVPARRIKATVTARRFAQPRPQMHAHGIAARERATALAPKAVYFFFCFVSIASRRMSSAGLPCLRGAPCSTTWTPQHTAQHRRDRQHSKLWNMPKPRVCCRSGGLCRACAVIADNTRKANVCRHHTLPRPRCPRMPFDA